MKREVTREKRLPAFLINIDELEILWERLHKLFDSSETIYSSIDITLPSETLAFKNVEELKEYSKIKGRITKFSFYMSQLGGRRIRVDSNSIFDTLAKVSTKAETEAWCAGAIETVYTFIKSHQLWYNWFLAAPIGWILFIFANIPSITMIIMPKDTSIDKSIYIAWVTIILVLAILYFLKGKLLPSTVLIITEEEGFIKKNAAELSLSIAVISVILTIVGWFININHEDKSIQQEHNKTLERNSLP